MTWGEQNNSQEESFEQMDYALEQGELIFLTLQKCILRLVEKKLMEKLKKLLETGLVKEKIEIKLF